MRALYEATARSMRTNKGFTLIELLVVIAIIAILASLAIPQYLKYQRRAKVSSYAEPIARACIMDYAAWCMENPNQQPNVIDLANCKNTTVQTAGGNVTLTVGTLPQCNNDGSPGDHTVTATLAGVDDFEAACETKSSSIRCTVKAK